MLAFHTLATQPFTTFCMDSTRGSASPRAVLVVDDDPVALARTAQELRRRGLDIAISRASAGAFQSACELTPSVVVVALDNATGGGLPLIRLLATHGLTKKIPVVVTGCETEALRLRAQQIGTVVVLLGDGSAETLATEVERVIQESVPSSVPPVPPGFPVPCPKCAALAGVPQSVSTEPSGGTYVSLRCEACAQEWWVLRQADGRRFSDRS
jgi:ActR/RegA family two-component response regulator